MEGRTGFFLIFLVLMCSSASASTFYDDFNDGDISDWEPRCVTGVWQPESGMVCGFTGSSPSVLTPCDSTLYIDNAIEVRARGEHAFGVIARLTEENDGIIAYVSPDGDVARIRLVADGQSSTYLKSLNADFPADVWYDLTFTLDDDSLVFEISVPSTGEYWVLDAVDPDPRSGKFGLLMGFEPRAYWDWISATGTEQDICISWLYTDDTAAGNGNMAFEAGEGIDLDIQLMNPGDESIDGVYAVLQSLSSEIQVTQNYVDFGLLPAGEAVWGITPFCLEADGGTADDVYDFRLTAFGDGGYSKAIDFSLPLGVGLQCNVDGGYEGWTWYAVLPSWSNDWHVSNTRNHTPGGCSSFKCGDTGMGDYDNHLYCYLQSPMFNSPLAAMMSFWSWIDAQYVIYGRIQDAYDGGMLQYGRCENWIDLEPTSGYPFEIVSGTTGPFSAGTEVFSGTVDWTQWFVSIPDSLAGPGQLRFVFGSDDAGTREGWYVDDIRIWDSVGIADQSSTDVCVPSLQARPNPFHETIEICFTGISSDPAALEIYNLSGRLIAEQALTGSGPDRIFVWEGRDAAGNEMPPGVYIVRHPSVRDLELRIIKIN